MTNSVTPTSQPTNTDVSPQSGDNTDGAGSNQQQGGTGVPRGQQGGTSAAKGQPQAGQPIFRDWASI